MPPNPFSLGNCMCGPIPDNPYTNNIAYVLSTSQQSFPPSKYLVLAAVFAHFSRVVHTSQRPKYVHFLWATDTQGNSSTSPIILLDDATILTSEGSPHSGGVRYHVNTLTDLLASLHLSTSYNHAASPSCDCSKVIPAIWCVFPVFIL